MIIQVIASTDGKYIGHIADTDKPMVSPDGIKFNPTKIQHLGGNIYRYSNSNYVLEVRDITNG
jgi:hypothetical protein